MLWARLAPPLFLLCLGSLTKASNLGDLPPCAVSTFRAKYSLRCSLADIRQVPCLLDAIPKSACASSDQTCLCADTSYINLVETCVRANCSVKNALGQLIKVSVGISRRHIANHISSHEEYHTDGMWLSGGGQLRHCQGHSPGSVLHTSHLRHYPPNGSEDRPNIALGT